MTLVPSRSVARPPASLMLAKTPKGMFASRMRALRFESPTLPASVAWSTAVGALPLGGPCERSTTGLFASEASGLRAATSCLKYWQPDAQWM